MAHLLHVDFDRDIDFEDLARAVLPLSQHQLQALRRERAARKAEEQARDPNRGSRARAAQRALVDTIIAVIDRDA